MRSTHASARGSTSRLAGPRLLPRLPSANHRTSGLTRSGRWCATATRPSVDRCAGRRRAYGPVGAEPEPGSPVSAADYEAGALCLMWPLTATYSHAAVPMGGARVPAAMLHPRPSRVSARPALGPPRRFPARNWGGAALMCLLETGNSVATNTRPRSELRRGNHMCHANDLLALDVHRQHLRAATEAVQFERVSRVPRRRPRERWRRILWLGPTNHVLRGLRHSSRPAVDA